MSTSGGDGHRDGGNRSHVIDTSAETVSTTEMVVRRRTLPARGSDLGPPPPDIRIGIANEEQLNAFRELRTRLLAMAAATNKTNFISLVVGVTRGSGASFVTRNLALAFTLQDHQIAILVDCNLKHPSQHRALGITADEGGLVEFLDRPHNAVERLVRPTPIAGLHLIPVGPSPAQTREYFSSEGMKMVVAGLRQSPCCSFLDGPPVKGSPDARILSESADFIILVAGYGHDTVSSITEAASLFDPNKFAGVVFNERG